MLDEEENLSPGIAEEEAGGEIQELEGESPAWRVCATNSRCSWRRFLEMA